MLVVTWLEGLTWLILVSADVVAASSASAVAFVSPVMVGSKGLPAAPSASASVFTLFNLLPSFLAVISAPARKLWKVRKIS